ncbi:MAG: adenosylcobinamide-GDP ribazoletransferase, partial [Rhizobiales bacterium]|nr:adenosylcobinamide-GDP ribazoletransferase [Hyphomicrobiales bacterium]
MTFLADFVFDFYRTLRFATRLPLPELAREVEDPIVSADRFAPAFATSGVVVGGLGGLIAILAVTVGVTPLLAALIATTAMVLVTGALHEDGLADCADGFGGGRDRDRKLEIMRDSAIGTYGVLALIL